MLFADAEFEIHTIHLISLKVMRITTLSKFITYLLYIDESIENTNSPN